ncbi:MAG: PIG-L family deacetylase [Bryobacterales bacterium]|nr:PIG-L family deacetylase [Bryobacterales bacterium]
MKINRKDFLKTGFATGALAAAPAVQAQPRTQGVDLEKYRFHPLHRFSNDEMVIEREQQGKPHAGKVLAAIQPHSDDIPIFAGGLVAKLIHEGYRGYLIRTTNDDSAGSGRTRAETMLNDERDTAAVAKALGLEKVYDLSYRNHNLDEINIKELTARFVFLIRLLKIDTIISYDPWVPYDNNPDHYITARAVEAAYTGRWDYPEQLDVVQPHGISERYYFTRRGPQFINRIVEITSHIDTKVRANMCNVTQGPGGHNGRRLKQRLAQQGLKLPILGDTDESADFNYIKHIVLDLDSEVHRLTPSDREVGKPFGLEWAERYYYRGRIPSKLDGYIKQNAVRL